MIVSVPLTQTLKVKPQAAIKFLLMPLGTKVKKGDLLARKKNFLGKKIEVRAEVDGVLENLSSTTGELFIRVGEERGEEKSDRKRGSLKALKRTEGTEKGRIKGIFGFGKGEGELVVFSDCLEFTQFNKEFESKVIFAPSIAGLACLFKASALEVSGLVVGFLKDFEDIKREVPGEANLGFLVLSESEDEEIIKKLKKWEGKRVRVEGEKREIYLV